MRVKYTVTNIKNNTVRVLNEDSNRMKGKSEGGGEKEKKLVSRLEQNAQCLEEQPSTPRVLEKEQKKVFKLAPAPLHKKVVIRDP